MCLAVIGLDAHPRFPLIVAANRDEFHERPALPAHWWPTHILAGKDLSAGGTWFGVRRDGRWALVTNFREAVPRDQQAPSRGDLVTSALIDDRVPLPQAAAVATEGARYHGFNLLIGDGPRVAYTSNRASGAVALEAGIHGLSNRLLDTPWPKLVRSKARFGAWLRNAQPDIEGGMALLNDRQRADDDALPSTGVSLERERSLSAPFIVGPDYGTRCSTLLMIAADGAAVFIERSFDAAGNVTGNVTYEFETVQ